MAENMDEAAKGVARLQQQQQALAAFSALVVETDDLDVILEHACMAVKEYLDASIAKVLERISDDELLVRAGVALKPGVVGTMVMSLHDPTAEAFSLRAETPVSTPDVSHDSRFTASDLLREHGVRAFINVPIPGPGKRPYGVLEIDARECRKFTAEDERFLTTYANLIGAFLGREAKAQQLREVAAARDRLLVELEHRTKNDLARVRSLLNLQSRRSDQPEVRRQLDEAGRRVEALRLVHEKLHGSHEKGQLDLGSHLSELVFDLLRFHEWDSAHVRVVTTLAPVAVGPEQGIAAGLIVNEFVTNSFKHAFARGGGTLWFILDDLGGVTRLTLRDSGPGLPYRWEEHRGLGMQLIEGLARQIGGEAKWDNDGGCVLHVTFKVGEVPQAPTHREDCRP